MATSGKTKIKVPHQTLPPHRVVKKKHNGKCEGCGEMASVRADYEVTDGIYTDRVVKRFCQPHAIKFANSTNRKVKFTKISMTLPQKEK